MYFMQTLYAESINKIKQNKERLEKALKVKLAFSGKNISIESIGENAVEEYIAASVVEAMELGFTIGQALLLQDEELIFEKIYIKALTKRHDLERVRARLIGTKGKTKEIIQNLSGCLVSLHGNTVGIIGRAEDIKKAIRAIEAIIHGQKQSKVYSYLERKRAKDKLKLNEDLGLKIEEKPKKRKK